MTAIPQAIERAAEALRTRPRTRGWSDQELNERLATAAITAALQKPCEACKGTGRVLDPDCPEAVAPVHKHDCDRCNGSGFRSLLLVDPEGLRERLIEVWGHGTADAVGVLLNEQANR